MMKSMQLDLLLSSISRKIEVTKYSNFFVDKLRKYYLKKHQKYQNPWITINDFDGDLKFKLDRSSYIGSLIYWRGHHSVSEISLMNKILKPNMNFVDIGANQGEYSIFAAKRLNQGRVISFEPVSTLYEQLTKNIELNNFNNITTYKFALSDSSGYAEVYTSDDLEIHSSFNEGLSSLYKSNYRNRLIEEVKIEAFDEVWKNHDSLNLDIMKVDVEGSELPVLIGAKDAIQKYKPLIVLEVNEATFHEAGYSKEELIMFLEKFNYKFSLIKSRGEMQDVKSFQIPDLCNIFCF